MQVLGAGEFQQCHSRLVGQQDKELGFLAGWRKSCGHEDMKLT